MATLALYGSGEFEPWARDVDTWCCDTATAPGDRVLVVPTASAPEGEDVFARWSAMGRDHYTGMGLRPQVLEVRTRADAEDPARAAEVSGARLIFFSGGNPGYLAETMAGTAVWRAITDAVAAGAALAGCSAGAVFLGAVAPFVSEMAIERWVPGVGVLPKAYILPHFDMLDSFVPGLRRLLLGSTPEGAVAIGIDENTAMCGDGERWMVTGRGSVWFAGDAGELMPNAHGTDFTLPLGATLT